MDYVFDVTGGAVWYGLCCFHFWKYVNSSGFLDKKYSTEEPKETLSHKNELEENVCFYENNVRQKHCYV